MCVTQWLCIWQALVWEAYQSLLYIEMPTTMNFTAYEGCVFWTGESAGQQWIRLPKGQ